MVKKGKQGAVGVNKSSDGLIDIIVEQMYSTSIVETQAEYDATIAMSDSIKYSDKEGDIHD